MISTTKLVYDFRRKQDSILSGQKTDISLVDVIAYLNDAYHLLIRNLLKIAETDAQVREDLRKLEVKKYCGSCFDYADDCCVFEYPENLLKRLNHFVTVSEESCCPGIDKVLVPSINQSDDLNKSKQRPYKKASFIFEQINADEGEKGLFIYHQNEMEVHEVCIDYYRKPLDLHAPSLAECEGPKYYDYADRVITQDQDMELDSIYIDSHLTELAVLYAARDRDDYNKFNALLQSLLQNRLLLK